MHGATGSEGRTAYCSPKGVYPFSGPVSKPGGRGAPGGHASTATHRRRTSTAKSGSSCCRMYSADRQLAPSAGQHIAPSSIICTHTQADSY